MVDKIESLKSKTIYCHFSFKRPKGADYALFAVAFYRDFEGKKLIMHVTRKIDLWENHQFITAIQSYEHALMTIYENQGLMKDANIGQVMLVTDNSILAGWILNPKKNKTYYKYMERAVSPYRTGSYKEVVLGIGLCDPRKAEKSYKYCKEEFVSNDYKPAKKVSNSDSENGGKSVINKINIGEFISVDDIIKADK